MFRQFLTFQDPLKQFSALLHELNKYEMRLFKTLKIQKIFGLFLPRTVTSCAKCDNFRKIIKNLLYEILYYAIL